MGLVDEGLPGGVYVGFVGVRGGFVDGEANVVVGCWISKVIVQLSFVSLSLQNRAERLT